jgi:thioredoxin 1
MALEVTDSNIKDVLKEKEITVLDFWAPWCKPCVGLGPIISQLSEDNSKNEKVSVGKVNVDENIEAAKAYGIRGIPSILFFKNGYLVDRLMGSKTKIELQEKIDSLLS